MVSLSAMQLPPCVRLGEVHFLVEFPSHRLGDVNRIVNFPDHRRSCFTVCYIARSKQIFLSKSDLGRRC